jgi:signal transduction histidine kinase
VTREEAFASLKSGSPHERLRAARYLSRDSTVADLSALREARSCAIDSYVKSTLDTTIARLSSAPAQTTELIPSSEAEVPAEVLRKAKIEAVEWVTALLLHEVASTFGLIDSSASREVSGYPTSTTKKHIDRAQRIFSGIEQLKSATATPKPEKFDLAELILRIVAEENSGAEVEATPLGPRPLMVTTDPVLLRFAICNGVRNAIEAAAQLKSEDPHPVVITWGETEVDYWVAVRDRGPGLAGPAESAFEPGKSNKKGQHSGFGLAIARQAMMTLNGVVSLNPANGGGARYELRWGK